MDESAEEAQQRHQTWDSVESYSITINLFCFINDKKKKTFAFLVFYTVKFFFLFSIMQVQLCISHIQTM